MLSGSLDLSAPVQLLHCVRRKREVVATAWMVAHEAPRPGVSLYLTGELDCDTVAELQPPVLELASLPVGHLTVDLTEVAFMGADGGALLLSLRRALGVAGVGLTLGPASRCARRVVAILAGMGASRVHWAAVGG